MCSCWCIGLRKFRCNCLRGACRDLNPNNNFTHLAYFFFAFWISKFSIYVCTSELHPLIWSFLKESFRKMKNTPNRPKRLISRVFVVLSIVLKLRTPIDSTYPSGSWYIRFNLALEVEIWTNDLPKLCFALPGRLWRRITFFARVKIKKKTCKQCILAFA